MTCKGSTITNVDFSIQKRFTNSGPVRDVDVGVFTDNGIFQFVFYFLFVYSLRSDIDPNDWPSTATFSNYFANQTTFSVANVTSVCFHFL